MQKRIGWIDTIRFLSILLVAWVHFDEMYNFQLMKALNDISPLTYFVFSGFTGKMAVAMFSVLLGYFAAKAAKKSESMLRYTINRYVQFAISVMFAEMTIYLCKVLQFTMHAEQTAFGIKRWQLIEPSFTGLLHAGREILSDSVLFSYEFYAMFWCFLPFFISSILIYALVKIKAPIYGVIGLIAVFFLNVFSYQMPFVGIALMGLLLFKLQEEEEKKPRLKKFLEHPAVIVMSIVLGMLFYQEYPLGMCFQHFMFGISSFLFLVACFHSHILQKILSFRPLAAMGRFSLGIFLFHSHVYNTVVFSLYAKIADKMPSYLCISLITIVYLSVTFVLAWGTTIVIEKLQKAIVDKIMKKYDA